GQAMARRLSGRRNSEGEDGGDGEQADHDEVLSGTVERFAAVLASTGCASPAPLRPRPPRLRQRPPPTVREARMDASLGNCVSGPACPSPPRAVSRTVMTQTTATAPLICPSILASDFSKLGE